jgi:hypothetical protein
MIFTPSPDIAIEAIFGGASTEATLHAAPSVNNGGGEHLLTDFKE